MPGRGAAPGVEWVGGCLQTAFLGLRSGVIRPGARSSLRAGESESPRRVGRARGKGRTSPEVMQRRLDLAGLSCIGLAVYLGYVLYLGWNGGTVGDGSETALSYAVGAGAVVVPVALGLAGIALILRPFLPVAPIRGGRRGGDRLRTPARSRGADRGPRPGRCAQGPLRPGLLPSSRRRRGGDPVLGHDDALPAARRAHHRGGARGVRAAADLGPLGLGHGSRRPPRRGKGQARHASVSRRPSRRAGSGPTPT